MFAQWQANVFHHRQGTEQATVLKHHAPPPTQRESPVVSELVQIYAENPDGAGVRTVQQDHLAQQRRFTGAAAAD